MSVDREQIRRDAEHVLAQGWIEGPVVRSAHHCLALLAELERTETEANTLIQHWCQEADERLERALAAEQEARENMDALVKTTHEGHEMARRAARAAGLVEALRYIADPTNHHHKPDYVRPEIVARQALATWESE